MKPMSMLFSPTPFRNTTARNRLWLAPMCTYSAVREDGHATDWHTLHYGSRAVGGFGTIIVEATAVSPEGRISPRDLGLWDDGQIESFSKLVKAVHTEGALCGVQIAHAGRKAGTSPALRGYAHAFEGTQDGWTLVAPSPIAFPGLDKPSELDAASIDALVEAFAQAARRAVAAGVDVVEVHGAHGYLIHEFLSPLSNVRTDEYGGSEENRRRFLIRIVDAVRSAIGDKVLCVRLSAADWIEGGIDSEATCRTAEALVAHGVDVLHVSSGGLLPAEIPVGPGYQLPLAADVKRAVSGSQAKVVGVGLISSGEQAEQALVTGRCDAVAIGRVALTDPYAPLRWANRLADADSVTPAQYWRGIWA